MDPRYQVFISSTFRDLEGERQSVLAAVLELGHFPAGMEAFPAASATPWQLIEKIIQDSDYYILIVGGRYGSTDEEGVSYTEREYDLACKLGIPTLIFLHGDPQSIPAGKVEMNQTAQVRLASFRAKVERHHCKTWKSPDELKSGVLLGLVHEIRVNPRTGWIRGDKIDSLETLKKLNAALELNAALTKEVELLNKRAAEVPASEIKFAHQDEEVDIQFRIANVHSIVKLSWKELFAFFAPLMMTKEAETHLAFQLINKFSGREVLNSPFPTDPFSGATSMPKHEWQKIVLQFLALGYWEATETVVTKFNLSIKGTVSREVVVPGYKLSALGVLRYAEAAAILKR